MILEIIGKFQIINTRFYISKVDKNDKSIQIKNGDVVTLKNSYIQKYLVSSK